MDKVTIGLPRTLFYYNEGRFLKYFLEELNFNVIVSKESDDEIIELGSKYSSSEMCSSLKTFLGHISYLSDKCQYILNVRMCNCGLFMQGCPNYSMTYDLINNLFGNKIINISIDHYNYKTLYKELLKVFNEYGIPKKTIKNAYLFSKIKISKERKREVIKNTNKLYIDKLKVLIVGREYNIYDNYFVDDTIKYLSNYNIEIIYSTLFDKEKLKEISKVYSNNMYYKSGREQLGASIYARNNINGIVFISSLNCPVDLIIQEYIKQKIDLPYVDILIGDNNDSDIEKKLERFIYSLEKK